VDEDYGSDDPVNEDNVSISTQESQSVKGIFETAGDSVDVTQKHVRVQNNHMNAAANGHENLGNAVLQPTSSSRDVTSTTEDGIAHQENCNEWNTDGTRSSQVGDRENEEAPSFPAIMLSGSEATTSLSISTEDTEEANVEQSLNGQAWGTKERVMRLRHSLELEKFEVRHKLSKIISRTPF